ADALLEAGVLEAMEFVPAAEARIHRRLLFRVLDRDRALEDAAEGGPEAAEGLTEGPVGAAGASRLRSALDRDHVLRVVQVGERRPVGHLLVELRLHHATVTITAVARMLSVARGSITFQPSDISWS